MCVPSRRPLPTPRWFRSGLLRCRRCRWARHLAEDGTDGRLGRRERHLIPHTLLGCDRVVAAGIAAAVVFVATACDARFSVSRPRASTPDSSGVRLVEYRNNLTA